MSGGTPRVRPSGAGLARIARREGREVVAGCVMPTDAGIARLDREQTKAAELGSRELLEAMVRVARRRMPGSALASLPIRSAPHG